MNNEQTFDEVKKLLVDWTEVDPERVTPEAVLCDLVDDSLHFLEVIISAEERFCIEISDEESEAIKTVADLVQCVERNRR